MSRRVITTTKELDSLPVDSVVLDANHLACQKEFPSVWASNCDLIEAELIELPAIVLWVPSPVRTTPSGVSYIPTTAKKTIPAIEDSNQ